MLYTYEDAVTKFGSKYLLKKAVGEGNFFQQERGVYSDTKYVPALQIISMKYPKAVFTMDSAFYYHGLTDVIPEKYCIATDRDATKICKKNIIQIFENKNLLNLGVEQMKREGCVINIYSKERMLVELLRHKSKLPFDYYKEILLNYRDMIHDLDITLIQDYAYEVPKTSMIMELLQLEVL